MKSSCLLRGLLAIAMLWAQLGYAQLTKAEYFFDTDPGPGQGTLLPVNITPGVEFDMATFSGAIPIPANMGAGWHSLYVRVFDATTGWSLQEARPFWVLNQATFLKDLEYFFDNDPGPGFGNPLSFNTTGATSAIFNGPVSTTGIAPGPHVLYLRARSKNGLWGLHAQQPVVILPGNNSIDAAEYYFDTDPGPGNGTPIAFTGVPDGANIVSQVPTTGLSQGNHTLYLRMRGKTGGWGLSEGRPFFVNPVVTAAEWFVDNDPGIGNGTAITIAPGNPMNFAGDIALPGCLSLGAHKLYIRTKTANGLWGMHDVQEFTINQTPAALEFTSVPGVMNQCAGNSFTVGFTSSGAYAGDNVFTVQLSDASGSFDAAQNIGTLALGPNGCQVAHSVSVHIPEATPNGTGYRVRMVSSNPAQQADYATDITIQPGFTYYRDADGDGHGDESTTTIACSLPVGYVTNFDDCNDADAGVYQGIRYYVDGDGDGYGSGGGVLICASVPPPGYADNNTDCDDNNIAVHAMQGYYVDADGDGMGTGELVMLCAISAPAGYATNNSDCNDNDASVQVEQLFYIDADGDGYGTGTGVMLCSSSAPVGYATNNSDCNDANPALHQPSMFYVDADGDGYGTGAGVLLCAITPPPGYSTVNTDCNDNDALVHQPIRYYLDGDGDGFGAGGGDLFCQSTVPTGYAANNDDCNDADPLQKPGQVWYTDQDNDGYGTGTQLTQCQRPAFGKLASELTATSGDCNDTNPQINPVSQTVTFSGNPGFEGSIISPATGTPYTNFAFEVKYTDVTNSLPAYGYPRVVLDFEGDGNYTGGNDRTVVLSPVDVLDNTTTDGKIYRGTISQLATGANWKSRALVVNAGCSTNTVLEALPIVKVLPDLEIFANDIVISAPNPAVSSPLTITATIHNRSDFAAQNFVVRLINQYDPPVDYGDIIVANIPARSNGTVSWNITTPPDPAWCPLQVVVDATNLIDETNELNNTALRPFTNGNYNVPGAIEVTASASPSVSYPAYGAGVAISGRAIYTGTAVPLVDPSVAGAEVEITLVETGQKVKGVTNSAGYFSLGFIRPMNIGVYHFTGTITDFTLTGPVTAQFELITPPCQQDLTSRIDLSATQLVQGSQLNAVFTIENRGCAATLPTTMSISQSGGMPSTAGSFAVPALAPGETFTRTVNNILFNTPGSFGFSVFADATHTEVEQFEDNNSAYAYVNVLPALPDLVVYDGPRGSYQDCNPLPNSVGFILKNTGGVGSGPFTTHVKVYKDNVFLETLVHNTPGIAAQGYYSFSLPYTFSGVGTYGFVVEADAPLESNGVIEEVQENNNAAGFGLSISSCPPPVANLVLLGESCQRHTSVEPVDPAYPGTMTLKARVHNSGTLTAPGPIEVRFNLSNGAHYTASYAGNLAPGETREVSVEAATVAPATTTLQAMVDPANLVVESNESDNLSPVENLCYNFKPVVWCQSGPWGQQYVVNQSFQPRIEVLAEGLYYASEVKARFEVSGPGISGTINLGDAILANPRRVCAPYCYPVASLPSTFVFMENGIYTFTITLDPDNQWTECNEGDNVIQLQVKVVNQPDMRILSQYINPSKLNPDVNEPVNLLVSYENLGVNNIDDRMKLKVLVNEVELATVNNVAGLITGDKATVSIPVPWSSPLVGAHIIRAIIDSDNQVAESNETNNEATRAIIVGALANLKFSAFAPSNAFPSLGQGITLNATILNDGDEPTDGEVQFLLARNAGDTVELGTLPVSVLAGGTQNIQLPWFVSQLPANLVARIVNSTMLEATYDDNTATASIGSFSVVMATIDACGAGNTGTLTPTISGGQPPFTYEWSNGSANAALNAQPGTYTLIVRDAGGHVATAEGTIGLNPGSTYYADLDGDGFGNPGNSTISCSGAPVGYVSNNLDCDDELANVNPAAAEVCDGIDNNCDGQVDEGFNKTWYADADGDGYGNSGNMVTNCTQPAGYVAIGGDCNDNDPTIYPGAPELCDGKDNDCDGETDEGIVYTTWYPDADGDGYGVGEGQSFCNNPGTGWALQPGDCNDADLNIWRTVTLYVDADGDGYDNGQQTLCIGENPPAGYRTTTLGTDCNDADLNIWRTVTLYVDADGDGYDNGQQTLCIGENPPAGYRTTTLGTDCNDADLNIWRTVTLYVDADGDGYDNGQQTLCIGENPPAGYRTTTLGTDCNDADAAINPGAVEVCDGIDNNCNGQVDEGVLTTWYKDADSDGYGDGTTQVQCSRPAGYKMAGELNATNGDCNDANASINPGAVEVCDGIDNNCNGQVDEGVLTTWYKDADSDGYGDGTSQVQCSRPAGYKMAGELNATNGDCNDANPAINPGAVEVCDGIDNNCNGQVDEGVLTTWYKDADNDGYGDGTSLVQCSRPTGYKTAGELNGTNGDCNDANAAINPGATEVCGNGQDDDCDGQVDEGCGGVITWYRDKDKDGHGNPDVTILAETQPDGYVANGDDCNDFNKDIYPGAPELADGLDNNCDGQIDEGLPCRRVWYRDVDGDGYGRSTMVKYSCTQPRGYVDNASDCKDGDPDTYPGAPELPDGKDNNCNGLVDEGLGCLTVWYRDRDGDSYGHPGLTKESCVQPLGYVNRAGDCDDQDATVYPGAPEWCDGKDNNCDGRRDEGCVPFVITQKGKNDRHSATMAPDGKAAQLSIRVWPNPARVDANVILEEFEPGQKVELVLLSSDGRNLKSTSLIPETKGQKVRIGVGGLAKGYYLIRASQLDKQVVKKLLIMP